MNRRHPIPLMLASIVLMGLDGLPLLAPEPITTTPIRSRHTRKHQRTRLKQNRSRRPSMRRP